MKAVLILAVLAAARPVLAEPPALAVIVVVDQMPADFLERHAARFGKGGFDALRSEGAVYPMAFFEHSTTYTGPGHALIGSGQYAHVTGIVGNDWWDRKKREAVYCADDPKVQPSTPTAKPMSPRLFEGVSLAERVKKRWPKARVVGVSLKDRSAILTVGKKADAAYWFSSKTGTVVSSSYYKPQPAVLAFNDRLAAFAASRGTWTWSLSESTAQVCAKDLPEYHSKIKGLSPSFPHTIEGWGALAYTPHGNDLLEELAGVALEAHGLGRNPAGQPDVLAVSFSGYDYIAHAFGPDSCEIADAAARLDRAMARLLGRLKAVVPKERLVVVLTADHGSAPIPEVVLAGGGDAGRVDFFTPSKMKGLSDLPPLRRKLEEDAAKELGLELREEGPFMVGDFQEPCFYIDPKGSARGKERKAAEWLKGWVAGRDGVQSAHTAAEIAAGKAPRALQLSFRKDRSGDVCAILKPYWQFTDFATGTTHGQPHPYDQQVPLVFWGGRIPAGDHMERVSIAQAAPALARMLDLDLKGYAEPKPLPGLPMTP